MQSSSAGDVSCSVILGKQFGDMAQQEADCVLYYPSRWCG